MSIIKKQITIPKTARYFQLGEITEQTSHVIIACHGYAQMANYFLKWFEPFNLKNTVIIAPEGLSRFYWNGFSGKVVASWMTKEDREEDIKDYINYLDEAVIQLNLKPSTKISALGFSQGGATAARWVAQSKFEFENLILWAAVFPEDIQIETIGSKVQSSLEILFGDNDQFYDLNQVNLIKETLINSNIKLNFDIFKGEHRIYPEPLNNLFKKLNLS